MHISATSPSYQPHKQSERAESISSENFDIQLAKLDEGETLEAQPYQGTAFDNARDYGRYLQRDADLNLNSIFTVEAEPLPIVDAENTQHRPPNGQETTKTINFYGASMLEKGREHTTSATVSIGGTFVALQTTSGELATPFRPTEEHDLQAEVRALLQSSNGDFDRFVEQLQAKYGDQLSVEIYEEGEGPDYARAHELLNGSSWEGFINQQIAEMQAVKELREMPLGLNGLTLNGNSPNASLTEGAKAEREQNIERYRDIEGMA